MSEFESEYENRYDNHDENDYDEGRVDEGGFADEREGLADSEAQDERAADAVASENAATEEDAPVEDTEETVVEDIDEQLWDKANKAARLLRTRRTALQKEKDDRGGRPTLLVRALKLLQLKPEMTEKEMSDLLGVKLHDLDEVLAEAEKKDIVARIEPEEPDMRKVIVRGDSSSIELAEAEANKRARFVPGLSDEDAVELLNLLDKVIDPLVAMGLDEERGSGDFHGHGGNDRGGHGGFGGRGGDRGDRGGRGGFGGRGGDRGGRGGYHGGNRGGFGGHGGRDRDRDDRGGYRGGSRGGYRDRDDRGGNRGGFGGRGGRDRDDRGGRDRRDDRGSFRGNRGNRY